MYCFILYNLALCESAAKVYWTTELTKTPGISVWIPSPLCGIFKGMLQGKVLNIVWFAVSVLNVFLYYRQPYKGRWNCIKKKIFR